MKKILFILSVLLLAGCTKVDIIQEIRDANKDLTNYSMEMELIMEGLEEGQEVSISFGIATEIQDEITHSTTSIDLMGMTLEAEQYTVVEENQVTVYSGFMGQWNSEVYEVDSVEFEEEDMTFDKDMIMNLLKAEFTGLDDMEIDGDKVSLIKMDIALADMDEIVDGTDMLAGMFDEETIADDEKTVALTIGYDSDYLIRYISLDFTETAKDIAADEGNELTSLRIDITISDHNEIDISIPEEVLNN